MQGGVQQQHLKYCLDEFTFRFNHSQSNDSVMLFYRLTQQTVAVNPAAYSFIIYCTSSMRA